MTTFSPQYMDYIHSDAWRARRQRALQLAGHRCQVCGKQTGLQVHHITYANLGRERDADLAVLCADCHRAVTFWTRLWRFVRRLFGL